jgi:hypothetical protein
MTGDLFVVSRDRIAPRNRTQCKLAFTNLEVLGLRRSANSGNQTESNPDRQNDR